MVTTLRYVPDYDIWGIWRVILVSKNIPFHYISELHSYIRFTSFHSSFSTSHKNNGENENNNGENENNNGENENNDG